MPSSPDVSFVPGGLPWLGHALPYLINKPGYLLACHQRYGTTVQLSLRGPTLLITAPEDVRHVLVSAAGGYAKSPRLISEAARRRLGRSLFTLSGAEHAQERAQAIRTFHPQRLAARQFLLDQRCEALAQVALQNGTLDSCRDLSPFVAVCIVEFLLGADVIRRCPGWPQALEWRRLADEAEFSPLSPPLLFHSRRTSLSRLVHASIAAMADSGAILTGLLDHAPPEALPALAPGIEQILLAAYETTTMMLAWTVDLLARHPDWLDRCTDQEVAERVLSEALRLYPPTWLFVRIAMTNDHLPGGVMVPEGMKIYLSPFVSQRSSMAFEEPERFNPDRFLPGCDNDPGRYFPFGLGARSCLGERIARQIGLTVITSLSRRCRLTPSTPHPPQPVGGVTLGPSRPIRVAVSPRSGPLPP
jgi:cytochrome P450